MVYHNTTFLLAVFNVLLVGFLFVKIINDHMILWSYNFFNVEWDVIFLFLWHDNKLFQKQNYYISQSPVRKQTIKEQRI